MNGSLKKTSKTYYIADSEREQGQNLTLKLGSFYGIDLKNVSAEEIKNQYTLRVARANALKVMYKFSNLECV